MLLIKTYITLSPIHGVGVFTSEFVSKDTRIWQFDNRFDRVITEQELATYTDIQQAFVRYYGYMTQIGNSDPFWLISYDNSRFSNHSETPTTYYKYETLFGEDYAVRDLEPHTEITGNYKAWDLSCRAKLLTEQS